MQYAKELKELLRPLGIYDVDTGAGAAELESIGAQLDKIFGHLDRAETEALPLTAEGGGLDAWESLMPYVPASLSTRDRQNAIIALMRIDDGSFTPEKLNATLAGCGIRAYAEETEEAMTVALSFPGNRGEPDNFQEICRRIEQILPCHLAVKYQLTYLQWQELEQIFATWAALEDGAASWDALEKTGPEGEELDE